MCLAGIVSEYLINSLLINDKSCILPTNNKECIQRHTEVLIINFGNIFDVNSNTDSGLSLIWQIKFGIVCRDADRIAFCTNTGLGLGLSGEG